MPDASDAPDIGDPGETVTAAQPGNRGKTRRTGRWTKIGLLRILAAMDPFRRHPSVLGVAVALIWGLTFLSIKVALRELPPMMLALSRFVIASLVLPVIARVLGERLTVGAKDLPLLAAGGFIGVTLYFYFENNGVLRLTASESSIVVATIPVVTLLAERVLFGLRNPPRVYGGALLSFAGVALIVWRSKGGSSSLDGYLFMTGAALSWVAYSFLTRKLSSRYGRIAVTFWQIFFGMLGCIPFAVFELPSTSLPGMATILNTLYLGLFGSAIGYWLYIMTLERLGPSRSSIFINLIPVVSVGAAFILLGERLSALQFAGAAAVILGVFLATSLKGRR